MNQETLQELSIGEQGGLDMRAAGKIILERTVTLSTDVNKQIILPISKWLDDPDFLKKYEVMVEDRIDWAAYKRNQREWTKQQRLIAAERLRLYWQEIRRKRSLKSEMAKLLSNRGPPDEFEDASYESTDYLSAILSPFSPREQARHETLRELEQSRTKAPSDRLPWKAIIASELDRGLEFTDLPIYLPQNTGLDTVVKLQHLLQMETEGLIHLHQQKPLGDIILTPQMPSSILECSSFTIIDRDGTPYSFDWKILSDDQKNKVIADIKEGRILARCS